MFFGIVLSFLLGYIVRKYLAEQRIRQAEERGKEILADAEREVGTKRKEIELEGKEFLLKLRSDFEKETKSERYQIQGLEKRLSQKEFSLDRKVDILEKKEEATNERERRVLSSEEGLKKRDKELDSLIGEERKRLSEVSGLSQEEAKKILFEDLKEEVKRESVIYIKRIEDETRETAKKNGREIILEAIQRCAAGEASESTISVISIPEDMKGRVIGREGRNIRAFEGATGVDLIVDDTPELVTLSSFNIYRREIARLSLQKLVADGRIHPAKIEEIVKKTEEEMEERTVEIGKEATFEFGIVSIHPELLRLLGRLSYRTSYGQNVLRHSKEVAHLASIMAAELDLSQKIAKRAGLLHDIGKGVDQEVEGSHPKIGAEIASRYGESAEVIEAIANHHQDFNAQYLYTALIASADALSASRPGIRRETLESYIKRLRKLEGIATSFKGVSKAYAISAGREVRVIVKPEEMTDSESAALARDITKKVEEGMEYPGQVKVTVIRELRTTEYAK